MANLTDDDKYKVLYPLWGEHDLFEDDEELAVKLAREKFPEAQEEDILDAFDEFLVDNPI